MKCPLKPAASGKLTVCRAGMMEYRRAPVECFRSCDLSSGCQFSNDACFASFASHMLVVNPPISFLKTQPQGRIRLPVEIFLDQSVVAVSAVHTLRRGEIVFALEFDPRNLLGEIDQLIDGHSLA